jgi:hypothetical protein
VWGVVFILLSILMSFALVQLEELFDYEDISLIGGDIVIWATISLFSRPLPLGLELGVFTTIMRLEYLRGHIGEKRFASWAIRTNNLSLFARFSKTTLFYSAVFFLFSVPVPLGGNDLTKVFRSTLIYPVSSKVNFLFMEVFSVMRRIVQSNLLREKILIQGE